MWNGWGGIDGHYKKFHQSVTGIPYKQWAEQHLPRPWEPR